jgi:hypothetical protein
MKSDDYGRTNRVYHHIDTGEARLIRQPEETSPSKTGRCGPDAWGHTMTWGYPRVRQPLVFLHRSCPEEERGLELLCGLWETERHRKERLFPTSSYWLHSDTLEEPSGSPLQTWGEVIGRPNCIRMTRRLHSRWVKGYGSSRSCPLDSAMLQRRLRG